MKFSALTVQALIYESLQLGRQGILLQVVVNDHLCTETILAVKPVLQAMLNNGIIHIRIIQKKRKSLIPRTSKHEDWLKCKHRE